MLRKTNNVLEFIRDLDHDKYVGNLTENEFVVYDVGLLFSRFLDCDETVWGWEHDHTNRDFVNLLKTIYNSIPSEIRDTDENLTITRVSYSINSTIWLKLVDAETSSGYMYLLIKSVYRVEDLENRPFKSMMFMIHGEPAHVANAANDAMLIKIA
jgi:hypothetical protein